MEAGGLGANYGLGMGRGLRMSISPQSGNSAGSNGGVATGTGAVGSGGEGLIFGSGIMGNPILVPSSMLGAAIGVLSGVDTKVVLSSPPLGAAHGSPHCIVHGNQTTHGISVSYGSPPSHSTPVSHATPSSQANTPSNLQSGISSSSGYTRSPHANTSSSPQTVIASSSGYNRSPHANTPSNPRTVIASSSGYNRSPNASSPSNPQNVINIAPSSTYSHSSHVNTPSNPQDGIASSSGYNPSSTPQNNVVVAPNPCENKGVIPTAGSIVVYGNVKIAENAGNNGSDSLERIGGGNAGSSGQKNMKTENVAVSEGSKEAPLQKVREPSHKGKPHPLAGRSGTGPPIAPPSWRWKAGYRSSDMYFYSPDGETFRSQLHLHSYLASTKDSPPMTQFRWRFTSDEFKDGELPGTPPEPKSRGRDSDPMGMNKRKKPSAQRTPLPIKGISLFNDSPKPEYGLGGAIASIPSALTALQGQSNVQRSSSKPRSRKRKPKRDYPFNHILSAPTSYITMTKNNDALKKFLKEAELLKEKSERELDEFRNLLLPKVSDIVNLRKYPENVLRVFFFILRKEDAPPNFGKRELTELCNHWVCKNKRNWCLLELQRIRSLTDDLQRASRKITEQMVETLNEDPQGTEWTYTNLGAGNHAPFPVSMDLAKAIIDINCSEDANGSPLPESGGQSDGKDDSVAQKKTTVDSIQLAQQEGLHFGHAHCETAHDSVPSPAMVKLELTEEQSLEHISHENPKTNDMDLEYQSVDGESIMVVGHHYTGNTSHSLNPPDRGLIFSTQQSIEAVMNLASEGCVQEKTIEKPIFAGKHTKCRCEACSKDASFCYGCSCNICMAIIKPKDDWSFITCSKCMHLCHLECAINSKKAGVIKELGLDVELFCPSCLQRSDLFPFCKERIRNVLKTLDRPILEKQLTSAVSLMRGTERDKPQELSRKVEELHNTMMHNAHCSDMHQLLKELQKKLDMLGDPQVQQSASGNKPLDKSLVNELLLENHDVDLSKEEQKLIQCQKKAESDYAEWLKAEKHADDQRILLIEIKERVTKAEEEVKLRADCAASSRIALQKAERRLRLLKEISNAQGITKDQVESQRTAFNHEVSELQNLQHKVVHLNCESWDNYVVELSALLESLKTQRQRVESAQEKLERLISLYKCLR